jgi:GNAT superfamily N-acetyltransferase
MRPPHFGQSPPKRGGLSVIAPCYSSAMDLTLSKTNVREANVEDAAAIARVHVASWKTTYRGIVPEAYLDALDPEERTQRWQEWFRAAPMSVFVAEDATGIFGFANGGAIRSKLSEYDAELYAIYLLQSAQRRGAGRSLTLALASALARKGFKSMLVWALEQNSAVAFYQRLGAVPVGRTVTQIGGIDLAEIALGWPRLDRLIGGEQAF